MTVALAPPAPRMLPVWSTVWACYVAVGRNLGQLVRISWLWVLVLLPIYAACLWLLWTVWAAGSSELIVDTLAQLPTVVELPVLASMAVAWHRLLLREERVISAVYLRFDSAVWRYALLSLALLVVPLLVVAPYFYLPLASLDWGDRLDPRLSLLLQGAAAALAIGALLASLFALTRLSLMLPAVALGESASPSRVWRMTRNNTLRLIASSILCAVPLLLSWLVQSFFDTTTMPSYVIGGLIELAGGAVLMIFGVTLLSLAYRFFTTPDDGSASAPA
jgi:hypothetical protein